MAFGFFDPQKGQTATGIAQSRAMAAALLRSGGAPRNVGEGLNSIGDAIFYRSLIGDADASEKTQTDAFNSSFNSLIAPYAGGGQASAVPMPTAAGEVSATSPASNGVAAALMANDGSELGKYLSDEGLRSKLPAGMRNNNPGNIKFVGQKVPGIVGPSVNTDQGDPQAVFDTPENGMRAMYSLLGKKYAGGKMTPNQMIAGNMGWTPGNYDAAANVARYAGIGPDDDIGFTDPARASRFMQGLITQEHGKAGAMYPLAMIQSAIGGNTQVASATPVTATDAIEAVAPQPGYRDPQVTTAYANPAPATASAPPLSAPTTISAAPAVAEAAPMAAPQQVAQNFQPQQIDPRLIEAANSPFATPGQKAILGGIIQQQQQRNELLLKQQMQQADPSYQLDLKTKELQYKNLQNKTSEGSFTNVGDGYLFNNRTKEFIRAPQNADAGANLFQGNALDAQALNKLVEAGSITRDQALNIAAGKVAPDPTTGALTFFPASALVGGGAQSQQQPYVDLFGNGGATPQGAPQQAGQGGNGSVPLTGNRAPTEGQANAAGFTDRMASANNVINQLEASGTDKEQALKSSIPLIGNYLTDENFQSYDRAKRDFINAQLRRESGAAIGKDEYASADKQYFPQPGDSAQVLKDKAQARALAIQGMTRSAGPSYTAPQQEVLSDDIRTARDAIKAGAPRDKVIERLQAAGIDTTGL